MQPRRFGGEEDLLVYTYWGDRIQQDLRHELTHALLHSVLKDVPLWLDEGLAEYFEMPVSWILDDFPHFEYLSVPSQGIARTGLSAPSKVAEIWQQEGQSESGDGAVRVRHILYSPNDDPATASEVAADDPAWAAAEAAARATYDKLKSDPSQFDAIARAESDESAAVTTGGKLPYFSNEDAVDPAFASAIHKPGLQPGQLLEPVKSAFGWHVIQVMHFPTDVEWANTLKQQIGAGTLTPSTTASR